MIYVAGLHVYPIKSCRGVPLNEAVLSDRGLAGDRRYMVTDGEGKFLSQREEPRLALVRVTLTPEELLLDAPDTAPMALPHHLPGGPAVQAQVWGDPVAGIEHEAGGRWFSAFLGRPARLVYMPDAARRPVDRAQGPGGPLVSLADGYPLLLASHSSLDELNRRLERPLPMARFRPNVVVAGAAAFAEDRWARLRIGEVEFTGPKLCDRCSITTVDIDSAARDKEPLATLAHFRRWDGKVWFALNLIHQGPGSLRVGDRVVVVEERERAPQVD